MSEAATRGVAIAVLVLLVVLVFALMRHGWRGRARRQSDLPPLPAVPTPVERADPGDEAVYVSTTTAGDWLDRIVVHRLGERSAARVLVRPDGVLVAREGAPDVWIARRMLRGVRRERGQAGKYVERDGLLVLTWHHGSRDLDTAVRLRHADRMTQLEQEVRALAAGTGGEDDGA